LLSPVLGDGDTSKKTAWVQLSGAIWSVGNSLFKRKDVGEVVERLANSAGF
jgi:hypothetical protein